VKEGEDKFYTFSRQKEIKPTHTYIHIPSRTLLVLLGKENRVSKNK
jgi:hypothetical protein